MNPEIKHEILLSKISISATIEVLLSLDNSFQFNSPPLSFEKRLLSYLERVGRVITDWLLKFQQNQVCISI